MDNRNDRIERSMRSVIQIARTAAVYAADDVGPDPKGIALACLAIGTLAGYGEGVVDMARAGDAVATAHRILARIAELNAKAVDAVEAAIPTARRSPLGCGATIQLGHVDDVLAELRRSLGLD